MPVQMRPEHLKIVQDILKQHVPNRRVLAFGSRAAGTASKTSDLDLCIIGDEHIPFALLGTLRDEFSLSDLPYKVDVIDWSSTSPDFRKIILENSLEIQGALAQDYSK